MVGYKRGIRENKEGQRVYVTEVIADSIQFLEPKNSNDTQQDLSTTSTTNTWTIAIFK